MIMYNFIFFNLIQNNTTHLIPQGLKNITSNLSLLADEVDILVFTKWQWLYNHLFWPSYTYLNEFDHVGVRWPWSQFSSILHPITLNYCSNHPPILVFRLSPNCSDQWHFDVTHNGYITFNININLLSRTRTSNNNQEILSIKFHCIQLAI